MHASRPAHNGTSSNRTGIARLTPIAHALTILLATGGAVGNAQAQQLGSAWFAAKGAVQSSVAATGLLPNGKPASSLNAPMAQQQRTNEQQQRAFNNLNMSARNVAALQAAQEAARLAALNGPSDIPDGLGEGGLKVDTNSLTAGWFNAKGPTQAAAGGKTQVTIEQTAEKAILNWESFNVGRNTIVQFDQKAGANADGTNNWIAFNRINDPSGKPSRIAGQVKADGSVYIVNRNGIVFHGGSQVNTRTLVASSLSLSDKQFNLGINNPQVYRDASGQADNFAIPQFGDFAAAAPSPYGGYVAGNGAAPDQLGGVDRFVPGAVPGEVRVEAGARVDVNGGGKAMLFAPKMTNAGSISAPDGQVILAAGENVYLYPQRAGLINGIRGFDVAVSAASGWAMAWSHLSDALTTGTSPYYPSYIKALHDIVMPEMEARGAAVGYSVTNTGIVESQRGNITMQGREVNQNGVLTATTALNNRTGSILLRAWSQGTHAYQESDNHDILLSWAAGTLNLGAGSVTQVLPDFSDASEIEASALATRYQPGWIGLYGKLIDLKPQAGVMAPSGTITMETAVNPMSIQLPFFKPDNLGDASRIYIDSGAFLSVAGLQDMLVPMSRNFIEAELRINELRDSPLLLDSWLRGKKVVVDRRANGVFEDGPMAGVNWVQKSDGGYIPGAWVGTPLGDMAGWVGVGKTDIRELSSSAGKITMRAGGSVVTREGSMIDVSGGSVRYTDGIDTSTRLLGADGRIYTMSLAMPDMDYVGIAGEYTQGHARWNVSRTWRNPVIGRNTVEQGYTEGRQAGSVQIFAGNAMVLEGEYWGGTVVGERQQNQPTKDLGGQLQLGGGSVEDRPWSPNRIVISHDPHRLDKDFDAASEIGDDFRAPPNPASNSNATGKITFLSDDVLSRSGMGSTILNISGDFGFVLESGAVVNLSPGASLRAGSGDGSINPMDIYGTIRAAGGSITLDSVNGTLHIGAEGRLDVSGQWLNAWRDGAAPAQWAIDAGAIKLGVGVLLADPGSILDVSGGGRVDGGKKGLPALRVGDAGSLSLAGLNAATDLSTFDIRAHAAGSAGHLLLETKAPVQLGGGDAGAGVLLLPATLYAERGFGDVSITTNGGGIVVPDNVTVSQHPVGIDLSSFTYRDIETGVSLAAVAPVGALPLQDRLRRDPSSLALRSIAGSIDIGSGAVLRGDIGGKLALSAGAGVLTVRGTLDAPAGIIDLAAREITLEDGAQLLARGVPAIWLDSNGQRVGTVLDGGSVSLSNGIDSAVLGLKSGALIDVSGASGAMDESTYRMFGGPEIHEVVRDSNGGSIRSFGSGLVGASMLGNAGGAGAAGGMLTIQDGGAPTSAPLTVLPAISAKIYWRDAGGVIRNAALNAADLDIFDEYGTAAVKMTSAMRAALSNMKRSVGTGMEISTDISGPGASSTRKPWEASTLVPRAVVELLNRYFYSDAAATVRISIPDLESVPSMRVAAGSISKGGFDSATLQSTITLTDGARVSVNGALNIIGRLTNGNTGGSAELSAAYIALNAAAPYTSTAWPAASTLGGQLTLSANLIDIKGDTLGAGAGYRIGGFGATVMQADEIRIGGIVPDQVTSTTNLQTTLEVEGKLTMRAGQVYPATANIAVVRASDSIAVERFGAVGTAALSAGGTLRLDAPVIEQNGVLRAPFGQIELVAGERLTLGADSITSVSGKGVVVPYGTLSNNEYWHDPTKAVSGSSSSIGSLTAPTEKRITMKAPDVDLARGAVVDIAGGGDLYAWEFVPGPGGSHDVLAMPGMYAIMPGYANAAPRSTMAPGQRVWLAGGPGLAAGWYTLLPARYALLPGAFAVQASGKSWNGPARANIVNADGSVVLQGKGGNAYGSEQDPTASAWRVMSGDTLRKYTEYNEAFANDFFSSEGFKLTQYRLTGQDVVTPRLARDGGSVVFDATRQLTLAGTLRSEADKDGRGGLVDIAGKKIAIVGAGQDAGALKADGYLVIDAAALSGFGAGSLLVGGTRKGDPLGMLVNVTATDIVLRNDAGSELFGPEIVLAATNRVAIDAGSVIGARGAVSSDTGNLVVAPQVAAVYVDPNGNLDDNNDGVVDAKDALDDVLVTPARDWGALVRVATGNAVRSIRQNVDIAAGGVVTIGAGAVVNGGAALLVDATGTTELASSARISGIDLSVSAGRIGFGGGSGGMVLDSQALAQLANSTNLTLRSYTTFDFHESIDLRTVGLASLTFDGGAFVGHGNGNIAIDGERIALVNTGTSLAMSGVNAGAGTGSLTLDADTLVLGAGQKNFSGFSAIALGGRARIVGEGDGGLDTGSIALTLTTPLLTGRGGAVQSVVTRGALQVVAGAASPAAHDQQDLQDSLGSRLSLSGGSVLFAGHAVALGGTIDMTASAGSLVLADGAQVDVGGFAKQFFDVAEYADAGRINLSAVGGDLRLGAGSLLNLAAHQDGGNAGTLTLAAANGGTVVLGGAIAAQAGAGGKAGAFSLDIAALADFAGFSQRLNDAGFYRSRQFRIRQGDVTLDGATTVEDFGLTADNGNVNITGSIDARAAYGGAIRITGGNGVSMQRGAQLLAGATGEFGSGRVTLEAAGGQLNLQGGLIDVSGNEGGKVRLRAMRNLANDDIDAVAVGVTIAGARSAVLEGVRSYTSDTVDAVKVAAITEANQFAGAAQAIAARLGTSLTVAGGIEIASAGDLAMNSDWNLLADFATMREGSLTLRAGGNLLINGHLSDGFDAADRSGVLQDAASWNLRLVAGADLASANRLAVKPLAALGAGSGSITVGSADTDPGATDNGAGKLVRTGTGDLEVRAARDLTLAHKESVIYTAGRKDMTTWSDFSTANPNATYGIAGGNLDIAVQGGIEAQPADQRFVEWLNRQGNINRDFYFGEYVTSEQYIGGVLTPIVHAPEQSSWWVNYGAFQQGVAAFGGGNVNVSAGGDLGNLVVALTSTMRLRGGRSIGEAMTMEVRNGGSMTVNAGGAIRGGQYYVARGAGEIVAGETMVGRSVTVSKENQRTQTFQIAPIMALGDATLSVRTAGDLRLQSVIDPLLVRYGDGLDAFDLLIDYGAYMSGYTDRTALDLTSTGGDITLVNQAAFAFRDVALQTTSTTFDNMIGKGGNRYPALIHATAMNGALEIQGPMYVMPGTRTDVRLMAQGDVRFNNQNVPSLLEIGSSEFNSTYKTEPYAEVIMTRATPAMMPSAFVPIGRYNRVNLDYMMRNEIGPSVYIQAGAPVYYQNLGNPVRLALADDYEPSRIYAAQGSIVGADLTASEQVWLRAGTDIRGMSIDARNVHASDVTLLEAGNDILAVSTVRSTMFAGNGAGIIAVQGPGALVLSAGRDVYSQNLVIQTLGNQQYGGDNRPAAGTRINGLPDEGAAITVMAGMNQAAGYEAFAGAYLDPSRIAAMPDYLKVRAADGTLLPMYLVDGTETRGEREKVTRRGLVSYMLDMTGETLAPLDAWDRFKGLPQLAQQQFLRQVYMLELREAGRDQGEPGTGGLPRNGGYNRGYTAIATLFPGDAWKGDVAANTMMLRTMSGGDINVLTPGGSLQLAALGATVDPGYGLVTLATGHINVFAHDDVTVNRSRILSFVPEAAARGSDQIIWSSVGDIDAGRGSKTVRIPSAAEVFTDLDGVTTVRERSDMSGSGIGTVGQGDVDLVAPKGTVNAGDAGIRVAENIVISAQSVLNADNIDVKGKSKGIPVVAAVNVGALTNASAAASQAALAAQDVVQRERSAARQAMPSIFTVRVLGFGNEAPGAIEAPARPDKQVRYDTRGSVQVVGDGALTAAQSAALTPKERANWRP